MPAPPAQFEPLSGHVPAPKYGVPATVTCGTALVVVGLAGGALLLARANGCSDPEPPRDSSDAEADS